MDILHNGGKLDAFGSKCIERVKALNDITLISSVVYEHDTDFTDPPFWTCEWHSMPSLVNSTLVCRNFIATRERDRQSKCRRRYGNFSADVKTFRIYWHRARYIFKVTICLIYIDLDKEFHVIKENSPPLQNVQIKQCASRVTFVDERKVLLLSTNFFHIHECNQLYQFLPHKKKYLYFTKLFLALYYLLLSTICFLSKL